MTPQEARERLAVVNAARRWIGTPYHHRASVLGAGVDCAQLLRCAYLEAGLITDFEQPLYNCDWHLHRNEEKYLAVVESYAPAIDDDIRSLNERPDLVVAPGDILMWRVGRTFSHAAIVSDWPFIIHSYLPSRMVEEVDMRGTPMATRPMKVFSYWGKP